jgi:hypothetical protein
MLFCIGRGTTANIKPGDTGIGKLSHQLSWGTSTLRKPRMSRKYARGVRASRTTTVSQVML